MLTKGEGKSSRFAPIGLGSLGKESGVGCQEHVALAPRSSLPHKNQRPLVAGSGSYTGTLGPLYQEAGESPVNLQILISIDLWVNVRLSLKLINKTNRREVGILQSHDYLLCHTFCSLNPVPQLPQSADCSSLLFQGISRTPHG